jgi:hypothetical protein
LVVELQQLASTDMYTSSRDAAITDAQHSACSHTYAPQSARSLSCSKHMHKVQHNTDAWDLFLQFWVTVRGSSLPRILAWLLRFMGVAAAAVCRAIACQLVCMAFSAHVHTYAGCCTADFLFPPMHATCGSSSS